MRIPRRASRLPPSPWVPSRVSSARSSCDLHLSLKPKAANHCSSTTGVELQPMAGAMMVGSFLSSTANTAAGREQCHAHTTGNHNESSCETLAVFTSWTMKLFQQMQWSRKFGLFQFLMFALLGMQLLVLLMASTLHAVVVLLVLFRSLPWAAVKAPVNALITPSIEAGQRATFHSIMSLACRLTFFATLLGLSLLIPDDQLTNWAGLQKLLVVSVIGGAIFTIPVWIYAKRNLPS